MHHLNELVPEDGDHSDINENYVYFEGRVSNDKTCMTGTISSAFSSSKRMGDMKGAKQSSCLSNMV